jgi:hypothetical protein
MFEKHIVGANIELKTCGVDSVALVVKRLEESTVKMGNKAWTNTLERFWVRIAGHGSDRAFEAGRIKAGTAMESFTTLLVRYKTANNTGESGELIGKIQRETQQMLLSEQSPMVLRVLDPAAARLRQV